MTGAVAIYAGDVVHERRSPHRHKLAYRVFQIYADVDRLGEGRGTRWLFGYNRFALLSVRDRDYADRQTPIAAHARRLLAEAGLEQAGARIMMLAFPRMLGYLFNPLTTYYCFESSGRLAAMIYEVNNTYDERVSYVLPAGEPVNGVHRQTCDKRMSVSPFTHGRGVYLFHMTEPDEELTLGIQFRDATGPVLRTHVRARRTALTSTNLVKQVVLNPFLTWKVIAAIHWEALRLALKGVPIVRRHRSPSYAMAVTRPEASERH